MNILTLLKAYKNLNEAEKKQKEFDKLSSIPLNYGIIRDLINSAINGVHIEVTLKDGTMLVIKRDDAFDKLQKKYLDSF
jgi:hypothetical protein